MKLTYTLFKQYEPPPQPERRRTAVLPKRNWIQRNPRLFSISFTVTSLLIFFSKPIYDGFIAEQLPATAASRQARFR